MVAASATLWVKNQAIGGISKSQEVFEKQYMNYALEMVVPMAPNLK